MTTALEAAQPLANSMQFVSDSPVSRRAAALTEAFTRALDATAAKLTYANFATCFPTPATHRAHTLERFHGDFVARWRERCMAQYKRILTDREVLPRLSALDGLIANALEEQRQTSSSSNGARKRDMGEEVDEAVGDTNEQEQRVPFHMLEPEKLVAAHLGDFLVEQQDNLNLTLRAIEEKNHKTAEKIRQQELEKEILIKQLELLAQDLRKAAEMVQNPKIKHLTEETRLIHADLRDS